MSEVILSKRASDYLEDKMEFTGEIQTARKIDLDVAVAACNISFNDALERAIEAKIHSCPYYCVGECVAAYDGYCKEKCDKCTMEECAYVGIFIDCLNKTKN